jgi:phage uncharacterized protein TIGR01671
MTREIKFRAWDKVSKSFLWPWPKGFNILGETTCFDLLVDQLKEMRPAVLRLDLLNDIEITQYTGLKDKNGKEIYEADILAIGDCYTDAVLDGGTGPTEEYFHLAPVVFQDACFGVMIQDEGGVLGKGFWSFPEIEKYLGSITIKRVGNIHDNPELIEGEKYTGD